jgi:hypothetical protein
MIQMTIMNKDKKQKTLNEQWLKETLERDQLMRSLNERHRVASYIKRISKQDPIKELQKQLK